MPKLFIRALSPATRDDEGYHLEAEWLITEDDGSVRAEGQTDLRGLAELVDPETDWLQEADNLVIIVPGDHVLGVSCEVPGRSAGQIRRALPFVVEEFVATDIEAMHLAAGEIQRGEPVRCSLVDRSLLEDWLVCLSEIGLSPGHMIAEAELLPTAAGQVSVFLEPRRALLKTTDQSATVDRSNLMMALESLAAENLLLVNGDPAALEFELDRLEGVTVLTGDEEGADGSTLAYLANRWQADGDGVNLLQGAYTPKRPVSPVWARWQGVAALAAAWAGVGVLAMVAEGLWAGSQADRLEAESEALYKDIYPQERRITNVRRQMQAKLGVRSGGEGPGFTEYLAELAAALGQGSTVTGLNYNDARDELGADLVVRSYEQAETLQTAIKDRGLNAGITSAEQQEGGVRVRLRVGGA
jgi:general secretion pathway protein L